MLSSLIETNMSMSNTKPNTNPTKPIFIFIDGSYYIFHRVYALIQWWKKANKEETLEQPFLNELFVEKFKTTFINNLKQIKKKLKLPKNIEPHIIIGKDCKRENIWRMKYYPQYKANRTHDENINIGEFFKLTYQEELFQKGGAKIMLNHDKLEADDVIALSIKFLENHYSSHNPNIYVITGDKDYLQLAKTNVKLYNLAFKDLTKLKNCTGDPKCDLFLKIVIGDSSDNIKPIIQKCGPKTALKYYLNKELFEEKLNENSTYRENYELNSLLVDFNNIPSELVSEFYNENILKK